VGSAGVNIATEIWKQIMSEHESSPDSTGSENNETIYPHSMFYESSDGVYSPRGIVVDHDPFTINKLLKSPIAEKFDKQKQLFS